MLTTAAPKKDFKLMSDQLAWITEFKSKKLAKSYKEMMITHLKNILDEYLQFFSVETNKK